MSSILKHIIRLYASLGLRDIACLFFSLVLAFISTNFIDIKNDFLLNSMTIIFTIVITLFVLLITLCGFMWGQLIVIRDVIKKQGILDMINNVVDYMIIEGLSIFMVFCVLIFKDCIICSSDSWIIYIRWFVETIVVFSVLYMLNGIWDIVRTIVEIIKIALEKGNEETIEDIN